MKKYPATEGDLEEWHGVPQGTVIRIVPNLPRHCQDCTQPRRRNTLLIKLNCDFPKMFLSSVQFSHRNLPVIYFHLCNLQVKYGIIKLMVVVNLGTIISLARGLILQ